MVSWAAIHSGGRQPTGEDIGDMLYFAEAFAQMSAHTALCVLSVFDWGSRELRLPIARELFVPGMMLRPVPSAVRT